jgi:hypothetical protein
MTAATKPTTKANEILLMQTLGQLPEMKNKI